MFSAGQTSLLREIRNVGYFDQSYRMRCREIIHFWIGEDFISDVLNEELVVQVAQTADHDGYDALGCEPGCPVRSISLLI